MGRAASWVRRTPWLAGLPREVAVLAAIAFCVALGFGIVLPAIPIFATEFGVSVFAAGAVVSAFALMRFLAAAPAGAVVNRVGERLVLTSGLVIVAVSSLVAGLAASYPQLLVMRALGGIGSAMFTVSAMALLLRTTIPNERGRASSAFQAGFLFGGVTGPAIGGLAISISIRAPFFIYAGTLALAAAVSWLFLGSHAEQRDRVVTDADVGGADADSGGAPASFGAALRLRAYRAALMANFNTGLITFGIRASLVPVFVIGVLHREAVWAGVGFLVAATAQAVSLIPAGRVTDHRGRRPTMLAGSGLTAVGMAGLAAAPNLALFLAAMAVLGAGAACLGSAPPAVVGDVMHRQRGGSVVAAFQMVSDVGAVTGPLIAGLVADHAGYPAAFSVGIATSVALLVLVVRMPETRRG